MNPGSEYRVRSAVLLGALALALGAPACGGKQKPGSKLPDDKRETKVDPDREPKPVETAPPELAVSAEGQGETREVAYRAAVDKLALDLLGPRGAAIVTHAGVSVHDPAVDYATPAEVEGPVTVGLQKERVIELLSRLEEREWKWSAPAFLEEALARATRAQMAFLLCERRRALLPEATCEPMEPEPIVEEAKALVDSIRVRPYYVDGVPLAPSGAPIRPLVVVAEYRAGSDYQPAPGLSVIPGPSVDAALFSNTRVVSDDKGIARFDFVTGANWPESGLQLALDLAPVLGPWAEVWQKQPVEVAGRKIGMQRWTLVSTEQVGGQLTDELTFADALAKAVTKRGGKPPVRIKSHVAKRLGQAPAAELAKELPRFADIWDGDIDVVLVSETSSRFASRGGTHRVWFEAKAKITLYSAWTGKELQVLEDKTTASGVGEARADRAARKEVAEKLAAKLTAGF